ncbi:basic proline-rich protein-like [Hemicordylus capensis]|uniref:basic proline-rich protein-like n=1 Tax=Hemicordylus capensis TaxID=884348 RepID=UPI0023030606|nr:basic proline-rich protein-like [Hemicordylus capensis]
MKFLILLACILSIAVASPVRRSASSSEERRPAFMMPPPQLQPQPGAFQPAAALPPGYPQGMPIYVYYDPAQGIPPVGPAAVNPMIPGVQPFLPYPAYPGFPMFPPAVGVTPRM